MNRFDPWLLSFLWDTAALVMMQLDADTRVVRANRFSHQMLAFDPVGRYLKDFLVDFNGQFDLESLPTQGESVHRLSLGDGHKLPQTCYVRFIRQQDRTLLIGEIHSSEIEQMRQNLVDTNNRLSNLTRELHKKNADLERLNALKNQFLGMAAHDLRNPLGTIMLYSDYMLEYENARLEEQHVEFLTDIRSLSDFMLELINDLLDISAIEAGQLNLNLQPGDLASPLQKALQLHEPLATKKEIALEYTPLTQALPVEMDTTKIRQVLNNLLSNAIKYSPHQTRVTIKAGLVEGEIRVSVSDQGPGIPLEEKEKLFRPFSRLSTQATGNEKSTGLGLAICAKIIKAHRGRIWADNNPDCGTTFTFSLPAMEML